MLIPWGAIANALAILAGGLAGLVFGSRLPERVRRIVFQGLGLCTIVIGMQMALSSTMPIILVLSVLIGGVSGALLRLEERFMQGGDYLKARLRSNNPRFTEGMVNASLLFCIGAMAIVGSFDEGLNANRDIVYTKSIMDGFAAIAMASAYGLGVLFSALFVLIYQGLLTVFASSLQPVLGPEIVVELKAAGGLLVIGIGLNLLELVKIPLSNMLPTLLVVVPLAAWLL